MTRTKVVHAVAVAIAAVLLATLQTSSGSAAVPKTTITIKVTHCAGCTVTPYNFRSQHGYRSGVVRDGVVKLRVPTRATKGLGFFMDNSASNANWDGEFFAVARYKSKSPGDLVTAAQAARGRFATQCWAGTKRAKVTLKMKVRHFPSTAVNGDPVDSIRSWFSPTLRSFGTPWHTWKGVLGTQSVIDCSGGYPG